jgi:hypothetical protein
MAKRTKSVDTSSSDSEFMTCMGDLSLERLLVYKTAVTTEEKKLRLERQKLKEDKEEEIMILSMDLSKCNPLLRKYYEAKQQDTGKGYWVNFIWPVMVAYLLCLFVIYE